VAGDLFLCVAIFGVICDQANCGGEREIGEKKVSARRPICRMLLNFVVGGTPRVKKVCVCAFRASAVTVTLRIPFAPICLRRKQQRLFLFRKPHTSFSSHSLTQPFLVLMSFRKNKKLTKTCRERDFFFQSKELRIHLFKI